MMGSKRQTTMVGPRRRLLVAGACCLLVALGSTAAEGDAAAVAEGGLLRGGGGGKGPAGDRQQRRRLSQYVIPKYKGYPVDYCLHYETTHYGPNNSLVSRRGDGCGDSAADKFCQMLGYEAAEYSTGIYYSSNATWVLGDNVLNPRDEHMGKGEHTWFDRISCKHPQVSNATAEARWVTSAVGEEGEQALVPEARGLPQEQQEDAPKTGSATQQPPTAG